MTEYGLSQGQYLKARRIRAHKPGVSIKYIALHVGATERQVRDALDSTPRPQHVRKDRRIKKKRLELPSGPSGRMDAGLCEHAGIRVPENVAEERDRRLAMSPTSLTAALLGDPPPGHRQYLDQLAASTRRRA